MTASRSPAFIVGAPRSGTKIFRDTLEASSRVSTTDHPLEEIWTYGQDEAPHEAYPADSITPDIRRYVKETFQQRQSEGVLFVEKNVRNSLRIPYIREVFPDARFVHIVRDPTDLVVSLRERWQNPIDWNYYLSLRGLKLSLRDVVYYSARLGYKFIKRILTGRQRVDVWGPHYPGLNEDLETKSLLEVCALQWKHCVSRVRQDGPNPEETYFEFHYESLMKQPESVLEPLGEFLEIEETDPWLTFARNAYRTDSIGRGRKTLSDDELAKVKSITAELRNSLGYEQKG